jgi:hypothetical protein
MAAPLELLRHGSLATPVLVSDRVRRSSRGLDEGTLVYHCDRSEVFKPGAESPLYPGLRINDVDEDVQPGRIEVTLHVSGLKEGNTRQIGLSWDENPFGWDVAHEERIERSNKASVAWGTALSGFANMRYLGGGSSDRLDGRWKTESLEYRGIRRTGLVHRQATNNDNIVTPGEPIIVNLPGGWEDARNSQISLPRIVVVETVKTTSAPDLTAIPGNVTLPISGVAFPAVSSIPSTISGSDLRYNWPFGWKVSNIEPDQLAATIPIYVIKYTYEFVWEFQWG